MQLIHAYGAAIVVFSLSIQHSISELNNDVFDFNTGDMENEGVCSETNAKCVLWKSLTLAGTNFTNGEFPTSCGGNDYSISFSSGEEPVLDNGDVCNYCRNQSLISPLFGATLGSVLFGLLTLTAAAGAASGGHKSAAVFVVLLCLHGIACLASAIIAITIIPPADSLCGIRNGARSRIFVAIVAAVTAFNAFLLFGVTLKNAKADGLSAAVKEQSTEMKA